MQIFLDSADLEEIQNVYRLGIVDGITTNPSLIAKTQGDNFENIVRSICQIIEGDVSVEVVSEGFDGMVEEGKKLLSLSDNIVIKLPITADGLRACKHFSSKGRKVNMTLCFSLNQAILAAKAGATYVSPFIGRLDDIGQDGMELISDIRHVYDNYKSSWNTKILAASIRGPHHVYKSALYGADVVTIPGKLMGQLIDHPLTTAGLKQFTKDWENSNFKI